MKTLLALLPWWAQALIAVAVVGMLVYGWHLFTESYREQGRAEIQVRWDADKARRIQATTDQVNRWDAERQKFEKAERERDHERQLRATMAQDAARNLPRAVARVVVPALAVRVLSDAIDAGNPATATGPAAEPAKAASAAAEGADSDLGLLTQWGVTCIAAYDEARGMVRDWQRFYKALQAAQQ